MAPHTQLPPVHKLPVLSAAVPERRMEGIRDTHSESSPVPPVPSEGRLEGGGDDEPIPLDAPVPAADDLPLPPEFMRREPDAAMWRA